MRNMIKNWKISDTIYWGLALLPFLISAVFYSRLPEQVPTHWDINNVVDGYSGKNFASWGIPAFMLGICILLKVVYSVDPKRENIIRSKEIGEIIRWMVVALAVMIQTVSMLAAVGVSVNAGLVISVPVSLVFIVLGNYMPKCKQNYTVGIRLPWTLNNEENWNKTHRLAGHVWTVGGVFMLISALFKLPALFFIIIAALIVIPTVYSFLLYKKCHK